MPVLAYLAPKSRLRDFVIAADAFVRAAAEILLHQVDFEFL